MNKPLTAAQEIGEELLAIDGRRAIIHAHMAYPFDGVPWGAALVAGPHPLLGGNMGNNLVDALRTGLTLHGMAVLTFEYSPVKGTWSEALSTFWRTNHIPDEAAWIDDAEDALRWLQETRVGPISLIGYSFGCRVVASLVGLVPSTAVVCVSPSPCQHDLSAMRDRNGPMLVIGSDNDFACPLDDLHAWFDADPGNKELMVLERVEHFFRGREDTVVGVVYRFLHSAMRKEGLDVGPQC